MAQAARLNLRMQKEIKILLNDPPHGVSLNLSEDENTLSSLSSIGARIEGPEGTVYAKGVFSLKIQIPERYPFQPPNVTFVTPIYHPNIDNGGRICLDILNLPPKGAWQPSLNIATVLTSIGLLLSEPNPDDGLMAEISREYKYNRQVFDTNARSWTQKYANPAAVGATGWGSVDVAILKTQAEDTENLETLPKASSKDNEGSQRKMRLLGRKLSLKSDGSEDNSKTDQQSVVSGHLPSIPRSANPTACMSDVSGKRNASPEKMSACAAGGVVLEKGYQGNRTNLQLLGQKLPVASESPSERSNDNDLLPNQLPRSASHAKDHAMQSSNDVLEDGFTRSTGVSLGSSYKPPEGNKRNIRTLGLKMSLKAVKSEKNSDGQKENMVPDHLPSQSSINNLQKRPKKNSDDQKENMVPNRLPSQPTSNNMQKRPLDVVSQPTTLVEHNSNTEHQLPNTKSISNDECNQGRKKLCLLNRRMSLKSELPGVLSTCDKGYKPPDCSESDKKPNELPFSASVLETQTVPPNELPSSAPVLKSQTMDLGFGGSQKDANPSNSSIKQNAVATESIVVSDSEDSADECERPPRSRLSLMRRRLAGKLRS